MARCFEVGFELIPYRIILLKTKEETRVALYGIFSGIIFSAVLFWALR